MPFLQVSLSEAAMFNAIIVFASIIMLTYVRETLPAEKSSEMWQKLYVEKIKGIVDKEAK